ncbi:MAG: cupin domain-containing protein [Treponema sp.]
MMKSGKIFSIAEDNQPITGCTTSEAVLYKDACTLMVFSVAAGTNISPERYDYPKIWKIEKGAAEVIYLTDDTQRLIYGDLFIVPEHMPVGIRSTEGCVYSEIILRKGCTMNNVVKSGAVFALKDLLPYKKANVVSMDIVDDQKTKFVLMSFDAGTELLPHAAPGEAIVFCLEGEGIIGCGESEYCIHEGENFKFDKDARHYVKAKQPFKMALLLVRE